MRDKAGSTSPAAPKVERVVAALEHREPDRVPVGEFFWSKFVARAARELDVPEPFNPYQHFDLDLIVCMPNMDPHIQPFEVVDQDGENIVVKTGWGATIQRHADYPMPRYLTFETETVDEMDAFEFDDPADARRYTEAIDDQINGVGDTLVRGLPPWVDRLAGVADDFCVFGGVCEPYEALWRLIGPENALMKIAEAPDDVARFVERIGDFMVGITRAQIEHGAGKLSGLYVFGDVAYRTGLFFSPDYWRRAFKPALRKICDEIHRHRGPGGHRLKVIYHGCGNAVPLYEDMIDAGIDAYNPIEAKAGLDVVELKRQFGTRLAWNGNIDVTVLCTGDRDAIRREVLHKLNAAKGGGFIPQSDHSVPDNIAPADYVYALDLIRQYGTYPLDLGEYDEPM